MYSELSFDLSNERQLTSHLGALKATGNRGLQPAMDHIFEHDGQPVPDLSSVSESSSSRPAAAMDVDDDEDAADLASLGVIKGAIASGSADVEAKASLLRVCVAGRCETYRRYRASSVRSAARLSRTPLSPTSTLKRVGTTSLRNPQRRCGIPFFSKLP